MKLIPRLLRGLLLLGVTLAATAFAAQPLPQGKRNFSVTLGNLDTTSYSVVRIANYTFDDAAGTVAASIWSWRSDVEDPKQALNSHTCTFEGSTKTCTQYVPYGWMGQPGGIWFHRDATYTYNTSTGALHIAWINEWAGVTEDWTVTLPEAGIARLDLASSNYGLTHGRGWGSNAGWSTFKTMPQVAASYRVVFHGARVRAYFPSGVLTVEDWTSEALDLSSYTTPSAPTPVNCMHAKLGSSSSVCVSGCTTTKTGIIYHIGSNNAGRSMYYNHHCACLPTVADFPCYSGTIHPYAFQQIIDDSGALRGFVGVEVQNSPSNANYQFQLKAYFR